VAGRSTTSAPIRNLASRVRASTGRAHQMDRKRAARRTGQERARGQ
jgi:hypothetical protein